MFKKVLVLVVVFGFCICNVTAEQISSTWVGGKWGNWDTAENWSPAIVPDGDFYVTIDGEPEGVVVELTHSRTLNRLDCYNEVRLGKWTHDSYIELTLEDPNNGLTNYGNLEISSSGIDLQTTGNVTNYGSMEIECNIRGDVVNKAGAILEYWDHLNIYGDLYNQAGATLLFGDEDLDVEGDGEGIPRIENDGTIICQHDHGGPGEEDVFENRGKIQLFGGSCSSEETFKNDITGQIEGWGAIRAWGNSGNQVIQNKGSIRASSGALLLWSSNSVVNSGILINEPLASLRIKAVEDVNNQGEIEVNAGGVTFDPNLVNEPGAVIKLLGGTLAAPLITQSAGATFEGFGGFTGDVQIEPDGLIELTGPTNVFGDVTIGNSAKLEVSDGTTIITGHTTCNNGTIHMIGGRVICQGGLTNNGCEIVWEPGIDSNAADYNLDGRVNLEDYAQFAKTWLWEASWR
jgi:hypothetical protein